MSRKNLLYIALAISIVSILGLTFTFNSIQNIKAQNNSSNTNSNCIYGVNGIFLLGDNSCPFQGNPTVLSQVKYQIGDKLQYIVHVEESEYRHMVFGDRECGACPNFNITEACHYDSSGDFVPHLSDAEKAVITDLKNNFSISVCPFTGQQNVFPYNHTADTIIGTSGTVNVTKLTENQHSNVTNSPAK